MTDANHTERKRLRIKNPPIAEAIISVTVSDLSESVIGEYEKAFRVMAGLGYNRREPITAHSFQVQVTAGQVSASKDEARIGDRFFSSDGKFAVQFLRSGFIFSQIGAYDSWEVLTSEAKKIWTVFLAAAGAVELVFYQVRFLNKIHLLDGRRIEDFITLYIYIPENLPQLTTGQYLRLTSPLADPSGVLNHQQILLPPEKEGFGATMLLDNEFVYSALGLRISELWAKIDSLRDVKDDVFIRMITPAMLEILNA